MTSQHSTSPLSSFPSLPSLSTASTLSSTDLSMNQSLNSYEDTRSHRTTNSISGTSSSSASDFSGRDLSFREKMERLKDDMSTNLYMEGQVFIIYHALKFISYKFSLPLSIDDVVSKHISFPISPYLYGRHSLLQHLCLHTGLSAGVSSRPSFQILQE